MIRKDDQPRSAAELRMRAEAMATQGPDGLEDLSREEIRLILHELRVHQIELEMQNEELRRTQVEVAAARARYFDLYDLAPVGYCSISEKGLILESNFTAATLLGITRGALVNQLFTRFIFAADADVYYLYRRNLFKTNGNNACDLRMVRQKGDIFWARLNSSAAQEVDGQQVTRLALSDISEQKGAEAKLSEARRQREVASLFEQAPVAYHELDWDGIVRRVNKAECTLLGYDADELLGRHAWDMVREDEREDCRRMIRQKLRGIMPLTRARRNYIKQEGTQVLVEVHDNLVQDESGNIIGLRTALFNVTDATRASELIEQQYSELALTAEALRLEKERAQAGSKVKSEFLTTMSHEIRTPMNGVIGMAELLLGTELNHEQQGYAETVRNSAESLLAIINDILDFSRIEAGKLELDSRPFNFHSAIEDVVGLLAVKIREKQLELLFSYDSAMPREFLGDPGRIRQVVMNLISNAVKFTGQGHVLVEVVCKSMEGDTAIVCLTVHDTGIGIPADRQAAVFQRFEQVDSSNTRKYGGTGLGLAISKQLVELMSGTMYVVSKEGEGSSFSFEVPLQVQSQNEAVFFGPSALDGLRVLVVDSYKICRQLTARLCEKWGMRADEAESQEVAEQMLATALECNDPYHLLCLDKEMPELWEMREQGAGNAKLAVMLITSAIDEPGKQSLGSSPFDARLLKPIREVDLLATMKHVLKIKNATSHGNAEPPLPSPPPEIPRVVLKNGGRPRILLVEDNKVNQKVGLALLRKFDCTVDLAENGREALELCTKSPYDLIFMDCQMPVMDGYEATREIRGRVDAAMQIPIIALTAGAMAEDRQRCIDAGMNDYLSKPVRAESLRKMLEQYLS